MWKNIIWILYILSIVKSCHLSIRHIYIIHYNNVYESLYDSYGSICFIGYTILERKIIPWSFVVIYNILFYTELVSTVFSYRHMLLKLTYILIIQEFIMYGKRKNNK
jgi:hypothetical protein